VAVLLAVPSREDAVVIAVAEAVAVVVKVADNADPELLLLMKTVTPPTLTELSVVAADRDTRVKLVRTDTLRTDARVMRSDVVTARLATEEVAWATEEDLRRRKLKVKPLLPTLRTPKLLPLLRKKRRRKLPLKKKSRRKSSLRKKRRKTLALLLMISLPTERTPTSRTRLEITRRPT
jgi:hypothetical protein